MKHVSSTHTQSTATCVQSKDIQPNAIDVRLAKVFTINDTKTFTISESEKVHRGGAEVLPDASGWFTLAPGCYEAIMENEVTVAAQEAGWLIPRSTLNRNGIFITSGLYDSGYSGCLAGCLHVAPGPARIKKGTRVAQFLLVEAETIGMYAGDYGKGSAHDKKYGKNSGRENGTAAAEAASGVGVASGTVHPGSRTPDGSSSHPSRHAGTPLDGATTPTRQRIHSTDRPSLEARVLKRPPVPKRSTSLDNSPAQEQLKDIEIGGGLDNEARVANADEVASRRGPSLDERNEGEVYAAATSGKRISALMRRYAARTSMVTAAIIVIQIEIICVLVWMALL